MMGQNIVNKLEVELVFLAGSENMVIPTASKYYAEIVIGVNMLTEVYAHIIRPRVMFHLAMRSQFANWF